MDLIGVSPRLPAQGETVIGERFYTTFPYPTDGVLIDGLLVMH